MQTPNAATTQLGRRAFLKNGVLVLSAAAVTPASLISGEPKPGLKIGLVTDLHYADKAASGTRHYRETPDKLAEAATELAKHKPSFLVELGDFIDAADSVKTELGYLKRIHRDFSAICKQLHHAVISMVNYSADVKTPHKSLLI